MKILNFKHNKGVCDENNGGKCTCLTYELATTSPSPLTLWQSTCASSIYILEECSSCVASSCKKCVDYFGGPSTRCIDLLLGLGMFFQCSNSNKLHRLACIVNVLNMRIMDAQN